MADVAENATYADAATAISQGKRHLLVQDYTAAVTAFAEGLEMMSQKLGGCDDELGEPYLLYGRALLGLAREEAGVLGGGVPGSEEAEEDEDGEDEDGEDEKLSDVEEKDEESEETEEKKPETEGKKPETEEKKPETEEKTAPETKKDEKVSKQENEDKSTSNETDDKKIEEKKLQKSPEKVKEQNAEHVDDKKLEKPAETEVESVAGSSKVHANGSASNAEKSCNGTVGKSEDVEDGEDVNKEDDEEDPGRGIDLQVAWEVLELAKIVFSKRGDAGLKNLAETHRLLGEVAMESDNPQGAITDLEAALKLLQKMEPCEPRAIAELHYQLGLAHSLLNDFDASIGQFKEATTLLEARIKQLQDIKEPPKSDDPFYTIEGEIKELKELLPAIQEKITDMKDFKEEACRLVIEGIKNKVAGGCTNGAGTSNDGASSSSQPAVSPKNAKPASDISHLVRKKRKADDPESPAQSPCKKPTP